MSLFVLMFSSILFLLSIFLFFNMRSFVRSLRGPPLDENFLSEAGKKLRKREGVCQLGIPKKHHITVLEVSSERARSLGPST
ncbi:hypothetical protein P5673_001026 [Acropora cervicornis]|uniref:Uncharacterized protein n=1 Tax=Acropora cervicornis TaxID=6130 RepID=A0AAD9VG96_ACRCE|nr:hypothetical protein P5673_001026 [Acropora cervicornis]